ncbi:glutathione S-transferase N-terminal domain-containing protein [Ottowia thiooxydans]|uniref:glutathione S-transferase N-terminal domain-containing protein n=1 Tax=Ottowia thiooxydans TaxID=219182 RepID=UPI0004110286|nr:glutathione S-transferase N-terminal domain-containing protein [Ottowia thiooxydans]
MLPVLYTFRRCPYAMRARWAILAAGVEVEMREVALRDKPPAMLAASPKGTVPVLVLPDGQVIEQSLDIMLWALAQHDPLGWLRPSQGSLEDMLALIDACEHDFKPHLDRYKYPTRYRLEFTQAADSSSLAEQERLFSDVHFSQALNFLEQLSCRLKMAPALGGENPALADFAVVPFVRQITRHDRSRIEKAVPIQLLEWMDTLLDRADFAAAMKRSDQYSK